tara:strand:+ start:269 stop:460 length:192 start_codon:yes stop_codon:yes gene_type:complete
MTQTKEIKDTWKIYIKYDKNNGWEHECTEDSFMLARRRLKEYRSNCPQYPSKIIKSREDIEYA